MNIGEFYSTNLQCPCGSGLVASRHGDLEVCDRCKVKFLREIFDRAFSESDHDRWGGFLTGLGCERVAGLEEAKRNRDGRILIPCPGGLDFHILVPNECADRVLVEGFWAT